MVLITVEYYVGDELLCTNHAATCPERKGDIAQFHTRHDGVHDYEVVNVVHPHEEIGASGESLYRESPLRIYLVRLG